MIIYYYRPVSELFQFKNLFTYEKLKRFTNLEFEKSNNYDKLVTVVKLELERFFELNYR